MPRVVPSQIVALINQICPWAKDQEGKTVSISESQKTQCVAILKLLEQIPDELIRLESENYNLFISCLETIRSAVNHRQTRGPKGLTKIPGLNKLNPITLLCNCLVLCPDEAIEPSIAEFSFIPDPELKENLRKDISAANYVLNNGEWKAATVLAGVTVEALPLWVLQQRTAREIKKSVKILLSTVKSANQVTSAFARDSRHVDTLM